MPNEFQLEALQASIYVRNRIGINVNREKMTSKEAQLGIKPLVNYIKVQECKVFLHIDPKSLPRRQNKLIDRGRVGVFIGYIEDIDKMQIIQAPNIKRIITIKNVKFNKLVKGGDIDLRIPVFLLLNIALIKKLVGRLQAMST